MTRRLLVLSTLACLACGSGQRTGDTDSTVAVGAANADSMAEAAAADTALPPMPDYPRREPGKVTVAAVGAFELSHSWDARAGRCARPSMVLLIAEEPGSGASVLLDLPASDDLTGTYPVKLADSTGVVEPPAAQVGFQFFDVSKADAYQGSAGDVEVRELTDRRLSGRFAVTLRHIANNRRAQVAGTFEHVDVEPLPIDWCERAAAARDSLAMAADSAVGR
jgi:hypothetical protein